MSYNYSLNDTLVVKGKNAYAEFINFHYAAGKPKADYATLCGNMKPWKRSTQATKNCNMVVCARVHDLNKRERWALIAYFGTEYTLLEKKPEKADPRNRIIGFLPKDAAKAMDHLTSYYWSRQHPDTPYGYFALWDVLYNKETGDYKIAVENDRRDTIVPRVILGVQKALS